MPGFNFETGQFTITRKAAADLSTHQYKFVKSDANGDVVLASAAGEGILGVLQNKPALGQAAVICVEGPTQLVASVAINEGDHLATTNVGKAKVALRLTQATGNGSQCLGRAITHAGADNEIFTAMFHPMGLLPTADA